MNLETLLEQEQRLQLQHFNLQDAWLLGQSLYQRAAACQAPVVLEVYAYGRVLLQAALPGSNLDNHSWIERKRNTVLRFGHSSLYLGEYNRSKGREFEAQTHIDPQRYTAHGGSFPLRLRQGDLIGALSLSGLPQLEDHALVVATLEDWCHG